MSIDFGWTREETELRDAVARFCREVLSGATGFRPRWKLCGRQGLLGSVAAAEHGGGGLDPLTATYLMEALGEHGGDLGFAFSLAAHTFAVLVPLTRFGSDEQRARWLPGLTSGDQVGAHAITEPEAGSDVYALKARARRSGDGYVLDGTKAFVTNGPEADVFLVHAVTDPGKGVFGLSAFLVERGTPGLEVGPPYQKIGLESSPTGDVFLAGCRVPAAARLGPEGAATAVFTQSMVWERTCLFALYVGAMARQIGETIRYVKERRQFDTPIAKFQGVSHRVADMKVRLEAARLLLYRAAWNLRCGREDPLDSAIAKLFISEAAVQNGLDGVQLLGGVGVVAGAAERFLRDAIPSRVFSGTSEIQRNNIARALGL